MADAESLPMPMPLIIAHAPRRDRDWHALCWAVDDRMARIVLGAREGAVAAIRLAWWEEALSGTGAPARGEPMLERWNAAAPDENARAALKAVAGAWRMLLDPDPMREADWRGFGEGRGALFALIAGRVPDPVLMRAGTVWALWDVVRRDTDRQRAEGAFAAAIEAVESGAPVVTRFAPRALGLIAGMALDDIRARSMPDGSFTGRQYLRLLRRAFLP
jgi:hypothetical protein